MAATEGNRFGAAAAKRTGPAPTPGSAGERQRKYTVLLTNTVASDLDEDVSALSRATGRKVDKSEVLRVLVDLLHTSPNLQEQVRQRLEVDGVPSRRH